MTKQRDVAVAAGARPANRPPSPNDPVQVDGDLLHLIPALLASRLQLTLDMDAALAAGDREKLRGLAHRAGGGLAIYGYAWAAWACRQVELQAAAGEPASLSGQIASVRSHLEAQQQKSQPQAAGS